MAQFIVLYEIEDETTPPPSDWMKTLLEQHSRLSSGLESGSGGKPKPAPVSGASLDEKKTRVAKFNCENRVLAERCRKSAIYCETVANQYSYKYNFLIAFNVLICMGCLVCGGYRLYNESIFLSAASAAMMALLKFTGWSSQHENFSNLAIGFWTLREELYAAPDWFGQAAETHMLKYNMYCIRVKARIRASEYTDRIQKNEPLPKGTERGQV